MLSICSSKYALHVYLVSRLQLAALFVNSQPFLMPAPTPQPLFNKLGVETVAIIKPSEVCGRLWEMGCAMPDELLVAPNNNAA